MARLPIPGQDDGTWGDILNEFLKVAHNNNGTLKDGAVDSSAINAHNTSNTAHADIRALIDEIDGLTESEAEALFQRTGIVTTSDANYVVESDKRLIVAVGSSITLPDASTVEGQEFTVYAPGGPLTINAASGQSVFGQASFQLAAPVSNIPNGVKLVAVNATLFGVGWTWMVSGGIGMQFGLPIWSGRNITQGHVVKMGSDGPEWGTIDVTGTDDPTPRIADTRIDLAGAVGSLNDAVTEPDVILRCDGTTDGAWTTPNIGEFNNGVDVRMKFKIKGPSGSGQWYSELLTQTHDNGFGAWDNFELAVVWSDGPLLIDNAGNEFEDLEGKPYLFWEWTKQGGSSEAANMIRDAGIAVQNWVTVRFTQDFGSTELKMYREVPYGGDDTTADGKHWRQVGATYTTVDANSIDAGVSEVWAIGYRADADIAWVEAYNGIDANKIIDIKPQHLTAGATSFVDGEGNTWTTTQGSIVKTDSYTPANDAHWSPAPTSVSEALDQLAARLSALEP